VRREPVGGVCAIVAHPDDEIAFAGLLLADRGREVHLVHLTDGAPADPWFALRAGCETREAYATLRARELEAALEVMGLAAARRTSLGARDQEAALALVELTRALAWVLEDERPALVLTHAYEGGHPDHDAAAFASRAALALLGEHVRAQLSKSGISAPVVEHRRARRWTFLTGPAAALDTAAAAQLFRLFATVAPVGSEIVLPSPDDERTGYRTWVQRPGAALPRLHDVVAATLATAPKRPAR